MTPQSSERTDEERQQDIAEFRAFLKRASQHVEGWPDWKKNTLEWWQRSEIRATPEPDSGH